MLRDVENFCVFRLSQMVVCFTACALCVVCECCHSARLRCQVGAAAAMCCSSKQYISMLAD